MQEVMTKVPQSVLDSMVELSHMASFMEAAVMALGDEQNRESMTADRWTGFYYWLSRYQQEMKELLARAGQI